jgi:hypothetical protein
LLGIEWIGCLHLAYLKEKLRFCGLAAPAQGGLVTCLRCWL